LEFSQAGESDGENCVQDEKGVLGKGNSIFEDPEMGEHGMLEELKETIEQQ
jgi:hypothetical protein